LPQGLLAMPFRRRPSLLFALLLAGAAYPGPPLLASPGTEVLCDRAAEYAALPSGVPREVMLAITRVETGRDHGRGVHPWPWAVNRGGEGRWFATAQEAITFVEAAVAAGEDNIDIGCFQLNYRWHAAAFPSIAAMFDPQANADYASGFLARLAAEKGSWRDAVAAYHSRSPQQGETYLARFDAVRATSDNDLSGRIDSGPKLRSNGFPLLRSGQSGSAGSLVPRSQGTTRLITPGT
jgi:hypothetical protein